MRKSYTAAGALLLALISTSAWAQVVGEPARDLANPDAAIAEVPAVDLFHDVQGLAAAQTPPEFIHVRSITLDVAGLRAMAPGRRITLDVEGVRDLWYVDSVSRPSEGVRIVRCKHMTDPTGYLAFCTYQDATAMTMQITSRKVLYRLQFAGNDRYHIWRNDPANTPPEGNAQGIPPGIPMDPQPGDDDYVPPPPDPYSPRDAGGCSSSNRVLDIMMPYTADARDAIGGTTAMRAECALAVDHANTAYQNSAMSTRMRLVYSDLITYTESGDQELDLNRLTDNGDGYMDTVHSLRDSMNADLVELVTNTGSGIGWCPSGSPSSTGGFSTGKWTRIAATYTCAHETGHNLGGGHNVGDGGACGPSYGVGHFFGPAGDGWCSVMAYPTSSNPRILHYSNPNVSYNGYATGVPIGQPGEAYNARVLIDNDNTVEGFQLTRYDIYVDFAYGGFPIEIGTADFPYNTLPEGITNIDTPNTGAGENPTMYITSGSTGYTGTIVKAMSIIPCGGSVTIGPP